MKTRFLKREQYKNLKSQRDNMTDNVHLVGIKSDISIGAEEALNFKRTHWSIENTLHHILDDIFGEDYSSA